MQSKQMSTLSQYKRQQRYREYVDRYMARLTKPRKVPATWVWTIDGRSGTVVAHTRSEAKARVKDITGLKHLPTELNLVTRTE